MNLLKKSIERASVVQDDHFEFDLATISEILSAIPMTEEIDKELLADIIFEAMNIVIEAIEKITTIISNKYSLNSTEIIKNQEIRSIQDRNSTEIIGEEQGLKTLIETNQFLVKRNDELTKKLELLTINYEKLVIDNNKKISNLEHRIGELIESKVSVSKTPSFWVEDILNEEIENENFD